jgi:hypothetical protein
MIERTRLVRRKVNDRLTPHPPMLDGESLEEFCTQPSKT